MDIVLFMISNGICFVEVENAKTEIELIKNLWAYKQYFYKKAQTFLMYSMYRNVKNPGICNYGI